MNVRTHTHPFRVERVSDPGSDHGQHKTEAGAHARIRRLVAMSNGKRTLADYRVVNDMRKSNPVKKVGDREAARELLLYADNESALYPQKQAIQKNLLRKYRAGKFDDGKAVKLWRYWIDNAARLYGKTFSVGSDWNTIFTVPTRDMAATMAMMENRHPMLEGEHDYLLPKKNPRKRSQSIGAMRRRQSRKQHKAAHTAALIHRRSELARQLEVTPTNVDASSIIRELGDLNVAIADAQRAKSNPAKRRTRKKVRAKSKRYKITAQNKGKKMHFDGRNFSERPTVKSFALADDAKQTALALIRRYPILRKYRVRVESFP